LTSAPVVRLQRGRGNRFCAFCFWRTEAGIYDRCGCGRTSTGPAFKPLGPSNIIFGDDSLATPQTTVTPKPQVVIPAKREAVPLHRQFYYGHRWGRHPVERRTWPRRIIVDNQLGQLLPGSATAAGAAQDRRTLASRRRAVEGNLQSFEALPLRNQDKVFAFDIMTLSRRRACRNYCQSLSEIREMPCGGDGVSVPPRG
jgi:hypothetical protein